MPQPQDASPSVQRQGGRCGPTTGSGSVAIRRHGLQNPANRREILADGELEPVFGKKKVTVFEMNKHLAQHLKSG